MCPNNIWSTLSSLWGLRWISSISLENTGSPWEQCIMTRQARVVSLYNHGTSNLSPIIDRNHRKTTTWKQITQRWARINFPFHKNPICKGVHSEDAIAGQISRNLFSVLFNNIFQFPEEKNVQFWRFLLKQIPYRQILILTFANTCFYIHSTASPSLLIFCPTNSTCNTILIELFTQLHEYYFPSSSQIASLNALNYLIIRPNNHLP